MIARRKSRKFKLVEIEEFDARCGYTRCPLPGVSAYFTRRHPSAHANFWRDRTGRLVVRFSCESYVFHFEASRAPGKLILDDDLHEFGEFVAGMLFEWVDEGLDDLPSSYHY